MGQVVAQVIVQGEEPDISPSLLVLDEFFITRVLVDGSDSLRTLDDDLLFGSLGERSGRVDLSRVSLEVSTAPGTSTHAQEAL